MTYATGHPRKYRLRTLGRGPLVSKQERGVSQPNLVLLAMSFDVLCLRASTASSIVTAPPIIFISKATRSKERGNVSAPFSKKI